MSRWTVPASFRTSLRIASGGLLALLLASSLSAVEPAPTAQGAGEKRVSIPLLISSRLVAQPGYFKGQGAEVYVSPDGATVNRVRLSLSINGCSGGYTFGSGGRWPIQGNSFETNGSVKIRGTFSSPSSVSGTATVERTYVYGCGYVSGTVSWSAVWTNSSQPRGAGAADAGARALAEAEAAGEGFAADVSGGPLLAEALELSAESYPAP